MTTKNSDKYKCKLLPYKRIDCLSVQDAMQKAGWGISAFELPKAWEHSQGEDVVIAVLDTGADLNHPDLKNNLLDGINFIERGKPPEDDNGHGCVSPECLIHTNYGGIESIENLYDSIECPIVFEKTNDGIFCIKDVSNLDIKTYCLDENNDSKVGKINAIHKLSINQKVIEIELEGNLKYKLTPWHPVYINSTMLGGRSKTTKIRADKLAIGNRMIFPSRNEENLSNSFIEVKANKFYECNNCGHVPRCTIRASDKEYKCKNCKNSNWSFSERKYLLDESLAYLIGLIITDGYYNVKSHRAEISSMTPEILIKAKEVGESKGFTCVMESCRLLIYSKSFVYLLKNIGVSEKNKSLNCEIPKFIGMSSKNVMESFLAGVIDGDGCISKQNTKNRISTSSEVFAKQLCALLNSIGISSGYHKCNDTRTHRRFVSKNNHFQVVFSSLPKYYSELLQHPNKKERCQIKNEYNRKSRRIKSINEVYFNGYFYDFTTEFGNYIGNGHMVSNTHVCGILAAECNDIGMVGVCPKAKVRPVKVLDKRGNGNLLSVSEGIKWAADMGVDLITMSLGAPVKVQQVRKAIQYAAERGVVTFCAAGNAGNTKEVFYPANYLETIAIGAIGEDFQRARFSNTGQNLDFMAPGVDIFSTVPDDWYATLSGTSMACPFAVGVAALVLSYVKKGKANYNLKTADDYREIFKKYTTPIDNKTYSDPKFYSGFGIIDPRKFFEATKD